MFLIILIELALLFCSVDLEIASILAPLISVGSLVWLALFGIPNKHTANDNTSGVIALCELLEMLTPRQLQTTAFVFFDNEEYGLFGSSYFKKLHKKRLKEFLLINLDCISDGDHLLLVTSKDARKKYMELLEASFQDSGDKTYHFEKAETTMYPSDQINFPIHVAIAALNKKPFIGLYMDKIHTKRDCVFDEKNLQCICSGIQTLIEKAASVN